MALSLVTNGKLSPITTTAPILHYLIVMKKGEVDLEHLSEEISESTSLTKADCYAVVISLTKMLGKHLEKGEIVRLGHLCSF